MQYRAVLYLSMKLPELRFACSGLQVSIESALKSGVGRFGYCLT
jgi:hypothetical protein